MPTWKNASRISQDIAAVHEQALKLTAARLVPYALPLRTAWRTAAGDQQLRRGWLLELLDSEGRRGWGECAPLPSHGSENHTTAERSLHAWQSILPGQRAAQILTLLASRDTFAAPAARAAVECAVLDLLSQQQGKPLYAFLDGNASQRQVSVNAAVGTVHDTTLLNQAIAAGYRVIKLKLGVDTPARELAALQIIAAKLPPDVTLRLDANRAWDVQTASRMLPALAAMPIESVEEPLSTPERQPLDHLQQNLPFPLALDESMARIDADTFWQAPPVRRVICKLAPLGGLLPGLAFIRQAADARIECVVTTGIDGATATLAAAHLAAAGGGSLAHGLATSEWLAADVGQAPHIDAGRLSLPTAGGLGFLAGMTAIRPA